MTSQTPPKRGQSHSPPSRQAPPSAENQGNSGKEKNAAYIPPATKEKRQRSVVHYIAILFAAAFLLMLLTYVMDQRQNEATVDSLNQSLTNLQETLSNQNSLQDIYEDNIALIDQVDQLEDQVEQLTQQNQLLASQITDQEKTAQAMDWFWQIDEAYVLGRLTLCRELIEQIETAGLVPFLPQESITDNGRFSPAGRYEEIYEALH